MRIIRILLPLLLIVLIAAAAQADTAVILQLDQRPVTVFDRDDVTLTLTGGYHLDDACLSLETIIENNTNRTLRIQYQGACNGWSISRTDMLPDAGTLRKSARAKGSIRLNLRELEIYSLSEVRDLVLDYFVQDADTDDTLFSQEDAHVYFPSQPAFDPVYYEECPVLPTLSALTYARHLQTTRVMPDIDYPSWCSTYEYALPTTPDAATITLANYAEALTHLGFDAAMFDDALVVSAGPIRLARLSVQGDRLEMVLSTAARQLTVNSLAELADDKPVFTSKGDKMISFGDEIVLPNCTIRLDKYDCMSTIPTRVDPHTGHDLATESPAARGCWYVYANATVTNTSDVPLNPSAIFALCELADDSVYVARGRKVASGWDDDPRTVQPGQSSRITIAAEIPTDKLRIKAVMRLGFTESWRGLILDGDLPDFRCCFDSYVITLPTK